MWLKSWRSIRSMYSLNVTRWLCCLTMDDLDIKTAKTKHRPIDDDTRSESGALDNDHTCKYILCELTRL